MSDTLYSMIAGEPVGLSNALSVAAPKLGDGALALLYSPSVCQFAVHRDGGLYDHRDAPITLDPIFEARIFSPLGELRWLNDPENWGRGHAVLVSPTAHTIDSWIARSRSIVRPPRKNTYLLWGTPCAADDMHSGWVCLADARIGRLHVPTAPPPAGQRVCLHSVEYLGRADGRAGEHGNVEVIDELLLGVAPSDAGKEEIDG